MLAPVACAPVQIFLVTYYQKQNIMVKVPVRFFKQ